jgi:hypothetical protein
MINCSISSFFDDTRSSLWVPDDSGSRVRFEVQDTGIGITSVRLFLLLIPSDHITGRYQEDVHTIHSIQCS